MKSYGIKNKRITDLWHSTSDKNNSITIVAQNQSKNYYRQQQKTKWHFYEIILFF